MNTFSVRIHCRTHRFIEVFRAGDNVSDLVANIDKTLQDMYPETAEIYQVCGIKVFDGYDVHPRTLLTNVLKNDDVVIAEVKPRKSLPEPLNYSQASPKPSSKPVRPVQQQPKPFKTPTRAVVISEDDITSFAHSLLSEHNSSVHSSSKPSSSNPVVYISPSKRLVVPKKKPQPKKVPHTPTDSVPLPLGKKVPLVEKRRAKSAKKPVLKSMPKDMAPLPLSLSSKSVSSLSEESDDDDDDKGEPIVVKSERLFGSGKGKLVSGKDELVSGKDELEVGKNEKRVGTDEMVYKGILKKNTQESKTISEISKKQSFQNNVVEPELPSPLPKSQDEMVYKGILMKNTQESKTVSENSKMQSSQSNVVEPEPSSPLPKSQEVVTATVVEQEPAAALPESKDTVTASPVEHTPTVCSDSSSGEDESEHESDDESDDESVESSSSSSSAANSEELSLDDEDGIAEILNAINEVQEEEEKKLQETIEEESEDEHQGNQQIIQISKDLSESSSSESEVENAQSSADEEDGHEKPEIPASQSASHEEVDLHSFLETMGKSSHSNSLLNSMNLSRMATNPSSQHSRSNTKRPKINLSDEDSSSSSSSSEDESPEKPIEVEKPKQISTQSKATNFTSALLDLARDGNVQGKQKVNDKKRKFTGDLRDHIKYRKNV